MMIAHDDPMAGDIEGVCFIDLLNAKHKKSISHYLGLPAYMPLPAFS